MTDIEKIPIIRPGQRKPYAKATRQQIDERIGFVSRLLRTGKSKTQIHRAVRENFNVEWRQCDRYISWLTRQRALAPLLTGTKQRELNDSHAHAHLPPETRHLADAIKQTKSCEPPK